MDSRGNLRMYSSGFEYVPKFFNDLPLVQEFRSHSQPLAHRPEALPADKLAEFSSCPLKMISIVTKISVTINAISICFIT